jgi:hypothetical protein
MMMDEMKLFLFVFASAAAFAADVSQVHTVYILQMSAGLDQHIANRLTDGHVVQVVTDPKKADAVLTDHLGPSFEDRMTELYQPPPPPKSKEEEEKAAAGSLAATIGDTASKIGRPTSSFGGGKGTVFLVSVKTREVLWSTFEKPKDSRAATLERSAARISSDLKKSMAGKSN